MGPDIVVNDLSFGRPPEDDVNERDLMLAFAQTVHRATSLGAAKALRSHIPIRQLRVGPNYTIGTWLDNDAPRNLRLFIKNLATKVPFSAAIADPNVVTIRAGSDFLYDGEIADGLGMALIMDGIAVSLAVEADWHASLLEITIRNRLTGEENTENVNNAVSPEMVESHSTWIETRRIENGSELWRKRDSPQFAGLQFCDCVEGQLSRLHRGDILLGSVIKKLMELARAASRWRGRQFDHRGLLPRATPESDRTMNDPTTGHARRFICPDGVQRAFPWHVRLTPHEWRIHYLDDPGSQNLIVGYIGPHLPLP
jgi:hypothetical protein